MSPYWSAPDFGDDVYTKMHARDGVPGGCAGIATGVPPKVVCFTGVSQGSTPTNDKTIGLPLKTVGGSVALPNDRTLVSGTDASGEWKSVIADQQLGSVFTASAGPVDDKTYAPAWIDSDGDGQYDDNKVWHLDLVEKKIKLLDAVDLAVLIDQQLGPGFDPKDFHYLGSFPDGVYYGDTRGNHVFMPHRPYNPSRAHADGDAGTWYSNAFPGNVVVGSYGVSRNIIPEPLLAIALYVVCGVLVLTAWRR
jgi:hypothetical protein